MDLLEIMMNGEDFYTLSSNYYKFTPQILLSPIMMSPKGVLPNTNSKGPEEQTPPFNQGLSPSERCSNPMLKTMPDSQQGPIQQGPRSNMATYLPIMIGRRRPTTPSSCKMLPFKLSKSFG